MKLKVNKSFEGAESLAADTPSNWTDSKDLSSYNYTTNTYFSLDTINNIELEMDILKTVLIKTREEFEELITDREIEHKNNKLLSSVDIYIKNLDHLMTIAYRLHLEVVKSINLVSSSLSKQHNLEQESRRK